MKGFNLTLSYLVGMLVALVAVVVVISVLNGQVSRSLGFTGMMEVFIQ
ncbi:MAG: hypothetical protein ABEJ07_01930 [Candidatus Nanohaloarchaea archaeon]